MNLLNRIHQLKAKDDEEKNFKSLIHVLCKTYGWDYYVLMEQPIPFIWCLIDELQRINFEEEKEMKKANRGKHG